MIKTFILGALLTFYLQLGNYVPVDAGSEVSFKIKNLGVSVGGSFSGLQGKIQFDPANPAASVFDASVDVNSINTGIDMRDDHLKKEEYFDVQNYPRMRFVSTKITAGRGGTYNMTGQLTIKGVTKEISFPFTARVQNGGYQFEGEFKINRRDFKVGGSSFTMSDNLTVHLNVLATRG